MLSPVTDHITGTAALRKLLPGIQSCIAKASGAKADVLMEHGHTFEFGPFKIQARSTPGHTDGCMSFVLGRCPNPGCMSFILGEPKMCFTGDALLIRGCGRTDFQQGNPRVLYESVHSQILSLPGHCLLFPAHDYKGLTCTTVAEERAFNPRLSRPLDEFVAIMDGLGLPKPAQIDAALPANLADGEGAVPLLAAA